MVLRISCVQYPHKIFQQRVSKHGLNKSEQFWEEAFTVRYTSLVLNLRLTFFPVFTLSVVFGYSGSKRSQFAVNACSFTMSSLSLQFFVSNALDMSIPTKVASNSLSMFRPIKVL